MQKEHLLRGALAILLASILLGMSACGTNRSALGSTAARPHPGSGLVKQIDACSLVPQSQIEHILKGSVTAHPLSNIFQPHETTVSSSTCFYMSQDLFAGLSFEIYPDAAAAQAAFVKRLHGGIMTYTTAGPGTPTPATISVVHKTISGLGDRAILLLVQSSLYLYVQKDNAVLFVSLSHYGQSTTVLTIQVQQLAQIAVQKL